MVRKRKRLPTSHSVSCSWKDVADEQQWYQLSDRPAARRDVRPPTPPDDSYSSRPPPTASWLPLARCRPQSVSSACSLLFFHTILCCVLCYHTVLRAPGYWRLVYILALFVSTVNYTLFTCIWFLPKINWLFECCTTCCVRSGSGRIPDVTGFFW